MKSSPREPGATMAKGPPGRAWSTGVGTADGALCFTVCPAMPLADPEGDGVAIYAGGKVSNARKPPMFSRLIVPYLPNNPPRWPEVVSTLKKIIGVYAEHAQEDERMGEWIQRVGWETFFRLTDIPFTEQHIDDFTHAVETYRTTTQFRW